MSLTFARSDASPAMLAFARAVGTTDPVRVVGGRTQWGVGRSSEPQAREVAAPSGIISLEPAELIVRCGAGTPWGELDTALQAEGMLCPIDGPSESSTLGGIFSVGHSGFRRLRYGHLRDLLLEARYVNAAGELVKAGAPVVKNVTGYDLCRLLVGSVGTLGLLGEVVLRCRPRPQVQQWLRSATVDPFLVRERLYQPSFIGWNGRETYVCMEGSPVEIRSDTKTLNDLTADWVETQKPFIPSAGRVSKRPRELRSASRDFAEGSWLAEIGVGVVHLQSPPGPGSQRPAGPDNATAALNRKTKRAYDPTGRLNPGVMP
jgi:FAD/FMN-containing dehydrogenase